MAALRKREKIIDQLADHVIAAGLADSALRPLAAAIGTSDRMLLYYFADKAALMTALYARIADRWVAALAHYRPTEPQPVARLARMVPSLFSSDAWWPLSRAWLELTTAAARTEDPMHLPAQSAAEAISRHLLDWLGQSLDSSGTRREGEAALLLQLLIGAIGLRANRLDDVLARTTGR